MASSCTATPRGPRLDTYTVASESMSVSRASCALTTPARRAIATRGNMSSERKVSWSCS